MVYQMRLTSQSFPDKGSIPSEFAFAAIATEHLEASSQHQIETRIALSANRNPHFAWSDVPLDTQSFVLLCHDGDAPSQSHDVNQPGRDIPATLPRVDFFHWVLLDIPASAREIVAGDHSDGVTVRGKFNPDIPTNLAIMRHGINDYTGWFANDPEMAGNYYGYDGPCPPWNDSIVHHYVFTLYALDIRYLFIDNDKLTGPVVRNALQKHILAQASLTGTYTLNPRVAVECHD